MDKMRLSFYQRKKKVNKAGKAPIVCKIKYDRKAVELSLGIWVESDLWNKKKSLIKVKHPSAEDLNKDIRKFADSVTKIYNELKNQDQVISVTLIKSLLRNKEPDKRTLLALTNYYINNIEKNINISYSKNTLQTYINHKNKLVRFLEEEYKSNDIFLKNLDYEFILKFERFVGNKDGNGVNSIDKQMRKLKAIINIGIKLNWLQRSPFQNYRGKTEPTSRERLTKTEVKQIKNLNLSKPGESLIKDIFLFSCYTGLAYKDLFKLSYRHIKLSDSNEKVIEIQRNKTKIDSMIPVVEEADNLILKYNNSCNKEPGKIFPKVSNGYLNRVLKIIAKKAGIDKRLTCHVARHTFGTLCIESNIGMESVQRAMGHTSLRTTQHYAKVTPIKILNEFKKFENFFN